MPVSASSLSALLPASAVGREPLSAVQPIRLVKALKVIPGPRRRRVVVTACSRCCNTRCRR
jgi:hypothetical protein